MSTPTPGWYADPSGTASLRWWDGHAWTDYVDDYEADSTSGDDLDITRPSPTTDADIVTPARGIPEPIPPVPAPPIPSPDSAATALSTWEAETHGVAIDEEGQGDGQSVERAGTARWIVMCVASWLLVAVFITVLVAAWSHLGPSARIEEQAKESAKIAQSELESARSTLEDINRQIEEASK